MDSGHQEALAEVQGVRASWGQGSGSPGRRACGPVDAKARPAGSLVSPSVEWGCAVPGAPGSGVGPVTASVFTGCVTKSAVTLALNGGPVLSTPSPADAWRLGLASPPGRALPSDMWRPCLPQLPQGCLGPSPSPGATGSPASRGWNSARPPAWAVTLDHSCRGGLTGSTRLAGVSSG